MKKSSKWVGLLLMVSLLLSACGNSGGSSEGGSGGEGEGKKTTLTAWAWNVNVGAMEEAMALYQKQNPNVELKIEDLGRLDVYDKLSTGLAAGGSGLPDFVLVEDDRIQGYLDAFPKGFLNLSEKGFDAKLSEFPEFKRGIVSKDGAAYAFPFDAGPAGVFYRTDLFEQAGVDPASIETWDDYIAAGKKIKEKTGAQLLPIDKFKDDATFRIMLNTLGVYYYDANGNIDLTNPKAVQAMTVQKKLNDEGLIKDVNGWDGTVSATIDGSIASIPFGAWYYGTIIDQAKELEGKWGVFPVPAFEKGGNRAANLGGSSWMINAASDNADEAYKFLEFFSTSVDVQKIAMEKYGLFPSYAPVYKEDLFQKEVPFFNNQKIWKLFADEMEKIPTPYYTKDYAIGLDEAVKAQADVFNGKDPAEALKAAADRLSERTKREVNSY
ncbi:ABC transporter substrate-binding protein [Paenibacillus sp. 32O-W]|uniref:ABC transporter substrate-binding protein n=1 Tax=Paenibacillus sp. 32O-W TaxID=1695218 RepID=UPI000720D98A|nr:sugar ABC transporter substrate-binding protein [Paenibacillus sp. 32O-W]ALS29363.1 ABC transporter substrate-binding protein [Paenibacillus sp. 32O-W]